MSQWWVVFLLLLLPSVSHAATVCRRAADGFILETYGTARPGICHQDLVIQNPQYGFSASDIEELVVEESERQQLLANHRAAHPSEEPEPPIDIPIESFGAGVAGALAAFAGRGLVVRVKKKQTSA